MKELFKYTLTENDDKDLEYHAEISAEEGIDTGKVVKGFALVMYDLLGKNPEHLKTIGKSIMDYSDMLGKAGEEPADQKP